MRPYTLLAISLSVHAGAGAHTPHPDSDADQAWDLSGFAASATPHGSTAYFSFALVTPKGSAVCWAQPSAFQSLPSVPRTNCTPEFWAFEWNMLPTGPIPSTSESFHPFPFSLPHSHSHSHSHRSHSEQTIPATTLTIGSLRPPSHAPSGFSMSFHQRSTPSSLSPFSFPLSRTVSVHPGSPLSLSPEASDAPGPLSFPDSSSSSSDSDSSFSWSRTITLRPRPHPHHTTDLPLPLSGDEPPIPTALSTRLGPRPPVSGSGGSGGSSSSLGPGGAVLRIYWQVPGQAQQAMRLIPSEEIVWQDAEPNPLGRIQTYVGPDAFAVQPEADNGDEGGDEGGGDGDENGSGPEDGEPGDGGGGDYGDISPRVLV